MQSINGIERLFARSVREIHEQLAEVKRILVERIGAIIELPDAQRTFANTIQAYDDLYRQALQTQVVLEVLEGVHPRKVVRDAATKTQIEFATYLRDFITQNKAVYDAVIAYRDGVFNREDLDDEQRAYVHELIRIFEHDGLNLSMRKRARVRSLFNEIMHLTLEFGKHINEDTTTLSFTRADLDGIPMHIVDSFAVADDGRCVIELDFPTVSAVLNYARLASTRKQLYRAWYNKAYPENYVLLERIITLRQQLAQELGYSNYSAYALALEMARTPEAAERFLRDLDRQLASKMCCEFAEWMRILPSECSLTADGKLYPWDVAYVQQQYKHQQLHIDERELMQYFPVDHVLNGIFSLMQEFFDVRFTKLPNIALWHADVQVVEVRNAHDDSLCGYLILDVYQRAGKYSSASEMDLICAQRINGKRLPAVVVVLASVPRRTHTRPGLLSVEDVVTLLHEFGHAMHSFVNDTRMYAFASAINKIDFVEMPSQLFERVFYEKELLKKLSKHYKTGQPLPDDLIDKIVRLEQFEAGYWHRTYVGRSLFLLKLYAQKKPNMHALCRSHMGDIAGDYVAWAPDAHFAANFLHMVDYGPKYYSYLWSKVFAAEVYDTIKQRGGFTAAVGKRFVDQVLSKGGSVDPQQLLEKFLDRAPNEHAFLASIGALESA